MQTSGLLAGHNCTRQSEKFDSVLLTSSSANISTSLLASWPKQVTILTTMAIVLPVTTFFLGLHTLYYAIISFRVGVYRGNNMQKDKNYEQSAEFKHRNAVSHRVLFPLTPPVCASKLTKESTAWHPRRTRESHSRTYGVKVVSNQRITPIRH